ncbi:MULTISPECIES: DUF4258 domain-containing protein [Flavobacterium]|uniref:DUF4258 domain-containing protein n=1 Tax=Flavobacterium hankyongi TaxID=1176532 RepID=A0ABP8ZI94_9FLAO|nr:DUF4258 domain-containing protein [Flavobacterium sp. N1846]
MKFYQRLSYYLLGFLFGCVFLFFFLNKKQTRCSYFPNDRVLNNIVSKPFHYSPEASKVLDEGWIDTLDIKNTLTYGDVDFDRSNVKTGNGKLYIIEGKTTKNQFIELSIINQEDKAILKEIKKIQAE